MLPTPYKAFMETNTILYVHLHDILLTLLDSFFLYGHVKARKNAEAQHEKDTGALGIKWGMIRG